MTKRCRVAVAWVGWLAFLGPGCAQDSSDAGKAIRGCEWDGQLLAPGATVKTDCNTCSCGQDGVVHCTTIACVNPTPTKIDGGSVLATAPSDGGIALACTLPTTLVFGFDGGRGAFSDSHFLGTSGVFTVSRARSASTGDGVSTSCSPVLPPCGTSNGVSIATLAMDLVDPDVQAAFAGEPDTVFGVDSRPWDVPILYVQRGDGKRFFVGEGCGSLAVSQVSCNPVPPGVVRFAQDLEALMGLKSPEPSCQAL